MLHYQGFNALIASTSHTTVQNFKIFLNRNQYEPLDDTYRQNMGQTPLSRLELLMDDEDDREWFHNEKAKAEERSQHAALVPSTPLEPKHISFKSTDFSDDYYHSMLSGSDSERNKSFSKKSSRHREGAQKPALLSTMAEPDPKGRVIGQLSDPGEIFCPILAVSRLPYKFINANQTTRDIISQQFFASGKFWDRRWTV